MLSYNPLKFQREIVKNEVHQNYPALTYYIYTTALNLTEQPAACGKRCCYLKKMFSTKIVYKKQTSSKLYNLSFYSVGNKPRSTSPLNNKNAFLSVTTWPSTRTEFGGWAIWPLDTKYILNFTDGYYLNMVTIYSIFLPCTFWQILDH